MESPPTVTDADPSAATPTEFETPAAILADAVSELMVASSEDPYSQEGGEKGREEGHEDGDQEGPGQDARQGPRFGSPPLFQWPTQPQQYPPRLSPTASRP